MNTTKVFIVEDERIVAYHLRRQLVELGYDVVAAVASGEEALSKIAELRPDVLLVDIQINGGIDVIETAARIPPELGVAVIYTTAHSDKATLERAWATRPHGYLIRPYEECELHAAIQIALERKRGETASLAREDHLRSIFNAVSEGIFILDAESGTFIEVNEPGCRMLGYTADELIGNNVETLSSRVPPFTQLGAVEWIAKAEASGQPQRFCLAEQDQGWSDFSDRSFDAACLDRRPQGGALDRP